MPRVRGDDKLQDRNCAKIEGPAPRAPGRQQTGRVAARHHGTSPACAGTTAEVMCSASMLRDQLRVRGISLPPPAPTPTDQPPRARERRQLGRHGFAGEGTSPACAGTTRGRRPPATTRRDQLRVRGDDRWQHRGPPPTLDQPRVRGDDAVSVAIEAPPTGPAPRARGRAGCGRRDVAAVGTSPACAGTT